MFLWTTYRHLDDPSLQRQTKPKFIVILSGSPQDDPLFYILTTSEKAKHSMLPFSSDLVHIPAGTYGFFSVNTLLDAGQAGQLEVDRGDFENLYNAGEIVHKGF